MSQRRPPPARRRGPGPRGRPKRSGQKPPSRGAPRLPRDIHEELKATARSGRLEDAARLVGEALDALERDRPAEAAAAAGRAKSLAPRSAAVREILGLAHYRQEQFREALRELQAYRRMSGHADQNHLIADCHRAVGAPEKAPALAQEALSARLPAEVRAEAAVVGAAALADLERYEEAMTLLRRFSTDPRVARPHDLRVWYVAGDVLERAGRRKEAAAEFRRIVQHDASAFDAAERLAALS